MVRYFTKVPKKKAGFHECQAQVAFFFLVYVADLFFGISRVWKKTLRPHGARLMLFFFVMQLTPLKRGVRNIHFFLLRNPCFF